MSRLCRRARIGAHLEELELILERVLSCEYPDCNTAGAPLGQRTIAMLRAAAKRFQRLTAEWIRVGFSQGNFNSDNCLVGGQTLDYGPFGFVELYRPDFSLWTGSGEHYGFLNQPAAGFCNFESLCTAVKPLLCENQRREAKLIASQYMAGAEAAVERVGAAKLGIACLEKSGRLWKRLLEMMQTCDVDYTIFFRQLSGCPGSRQAAALEMVGPAFYAPLQEHQRAAWLDWLRDWLAELDAEEPSAETQQLDMKRVNPKYIPREWMLVEAYKAAEQGNTEPLKRLHELLSRPYDKQPEMESEYYRRCPDEFLNKAGVAFMT